MRCALLVLWLLAACAPGRELVVAEDFAEPAALAAFTFTDPAAWRWRPVGALELVGSSDYTPPHRSPLSIALLPTPALGDFALEVDLMQTGREYGHRDLCLFFGYLDPAHFYYAHLATTPDPHAHNVFVVDGAPRRALGPVPARGVAWGQEVWHRVRLVRCGARIEVFFDDLRTPVLAVSDSTLGAGRLGLGSFDDQGSFDNLRVWAPE